MSIEVCVQNTLTKVGDSGLTKAMTADNQKKAPHENCISAGGMNHIIFLYEVKHLVYFCSSILGYARQWKNVY